MTISSGIQINGIDGVELYSGVNKKVHITNDSKISLKGIYNSNSTIELIDSVTDNVIWMISNTGTVYCNYIWLQGGLSMFEK